MYVCITGLNLACSQLLHCQLEEALHGLVEAGEDIRSVSAAMATYMRVAKLI